VPPAKVSAFVGRVADDAAVHEPVLLVHWGVIAVLSSAAAFVKRSSSVPSMTLNGCAASTSRHETSMSIMTSNVSAVAVGTSSGRSQDRPQTRDALKRPSPYWFALIQCVSANRR